MTESKQQYLSEDEQQVRLDAFDDILIEHPRMTTVANSIDSLIRQTKRVIARNEQRVKEAGGRAIKLEELWAMPVIGPSGATKSRSLRQYVDKINRDPKLAANEMPIVTITVRTSTKTPKALQVQILEAFGEEKAAAVVLRSKEHSEAAINKAIRTLARQRGTAVVALDEGHNMIIESKGARAETMAAALKSMVNDGLFSIVLLGTEEITELFRRSRELRSRLKESVYLGHFKIESPNDREYFFGFAAYFEESMVKKGVIDRRLGLIDDVLGRAAIYDMAEGVVGIVPRVLRLALERAFNDEKGARGYLTWEDIAAGFRGWARSQMTEDGMPNKFVDPFDAQSGEGGPRWKTIKYINEDFPVDQRIKRRKVAEEKTGSMEAVA